MLLEKRTKRDEIDILLTTRWGGGGGGGEGFCLFLESLWNLIDLKHFRHLIGPQIPIRNYFNQTWRGRRDAIDRVNYGVNDYSNNWVIVGGEEEQ